MIKIDLERGLLIKGSNAAEEVCPLCSAKAFRILSEIWLRSGWDTKYVYSFTWLGRPIIQLPEDLMRIQEIIYQVRPDVIIETGVAHGGSLVFYASLCKMMDHGRVVGIDIEIRPHNRHAIESHILNPSITLIEGSSVDPRIIEQVKNVVRPGEKVLVMLDSCHTKEHVMAELEAYAPLVSIGSYIVAADGIMEQVVGAPRTQVDWSWNNPKGAAIEFVERHSNYLIDEPKFLFNEGSITERVTYWPCGFIKRVR